MSPEELICRVEEELHAERDGWEAYPLSLESYNESVEKPFRLAYPPGTPAVLVLSTPTMFDKVFVPWLSAEFGALSVEELEAQTRDPLDECMRKVFADLASALRLPTETLHDFDLHPSRRPKVLMGTAGHVAGAARYYQVGVDVAGPPDWPHKGRMGLSLHPRLGGWFAFRAVLVFPSLGGWSVGAKEPAHVLQGPGEEETRANVRQALELFNTSWQDWRYRDCVAGVWERYSARQKAYFATPPAQRWPLIHSWLH